MRIFCFTFAKYFKQAMSTIIKVSNLSKTFKDINAVQDLSFTVEQGSVYGFLGQNGAGKSTTIRMLMTLIKPTSGSIEMFGKKLDQNPNEILQNVGAVIERPDLYKYLSAYENVKLFAKLSRVKATDAAIMDILDKVGLADRAKSKMKTFSQGMKQRLGIAVALIHNPELIILDEPVNGLDPQGIADIRNLILHLKNDMGKTVLVSSHLLSEMEMIATDLLIINKGKKIVEGKLNDLLNPDKVQVELTTNDVEDAIQRINPTKWIKPLIYKMDNTIVFEINKSDISALNKSLVEVGVQVESLRPKHSLEDYFLEITGK
jgi:ABC-type multidrug transport system ATPase subunit